MKSLIVIPARLESTRLPRKLLLRETGKSLLQHTFESALTAQLADTVVVAADHPEIEAEVLRFGGKVRLTDPSHSCGTDRVAEIASKFPDHQIIVNVQGDEPELPGPAIDQAISILNQDPAAQIATLATPIRRREQLDDPSCVKVVLNQMGQALYFSRATIPFARNWDDAMLAAEPANFLQHVGLYAYRRDRLLQIPELPKPPIEIIESLEQLRVLFAGIPIQVGIIDHPIVGIDTAEDYAAFVSRQARR